MKRIQEKLANTKTIPLVLMVFASLCARSIIFCGKLVLISITTAIVVTNLNDRRRNKSCDIYIDYGQKKEVRYLNERLLWLCLQNMSSNML